MAYKLEVGEFTCVVDISRGSATVTLKDRDLAVVAAGRGDTVRAAQINACQSTKNERARRALQWADLREE